MRYLSRTIHCSLCDEPMTDNNMIRIYHIENNDEVTDGIVHAECADAFCAEEN